MSIINIIIEDDRALVGVDTLAGFMDFANEEFGQAERIDRHTCKFSMLPQISAIMTHRGDALLTALVRQQIDLSLARDFEDAAGYMPEFLDQSYDHVMALREQQFGAQPFAGAEVVLVGWSPTAKRFEGMRWHRYPEDQEFIATRIDGMVFLPQIDQAERPDTAAKMEALMRRQVSQTRRDNPGYACGGKAMLIEITRDAANVRTIADLEKATSFSEEVNHA